MPAFWDASALVPLCVPGQVGTRGRELLHEQKPVVWWVTPVEIVSALARLRREGKLSLAQAQVAAKRLAMLRSTWREVQPVNEVRDLAELQMERYELCAGDALQLAAALVWCDQRPWRRNFICQDRRLGEAAHQAGFTVMDW